MSYHAPGFPDRWELDVRPTDVVAIGSQLALGSVGLNTTTAALTAAGLRTAPFPTIILGNLPHYENVSAQTIDPQWLAGALADINSLGVDSDVSTILTGYFASPAQVEVVAAWIKDVVARRPEVRVIVDPTLGDHDVGMYTDPLVADAIVEHLLELATGLTPNDYELEMLAATRGIPASSSAAHKARSLLGERGEWAVTTSSGEPVDTVGCLVVTDTDEVPVHVPRVPSSAKGTGDLFCATLTARLHSGAQIVDAARDASLAVHSALARRQDQLAGHTVSALNRGSFSQDAVQYD